MGKPMSKNLLKAGYSLVVSDRNPEAIAEVIAAGAETASTAKAIAEQCDVIITMLPNSPHVKDVALGEGGIIEGAKPGTVLIDMSSIAPLASREISDALKAKGIDMLDAPVSGGEPKAIDGTLSVMVGGDKAIFDKYYDLLKAMAGSVVHTGEIGAGNVTKLANQVIVALNIAAMSEALTLATKAGVNPDWYIRRFAAVWRAVPCWMRKRRWSWIATSNRASVSICILKIWRTRWIRRTVSARSAADRCGDGDDAGATRGRAGDGRSQRAGMLLRKTGESGSHSLITSCLVARSNLACLSQAGTVKRQLALCSNRLPL